MDRRPRRGTRHSDLDRNVKESALDAKHRVLHKAVKCRPISVAGRWVRQEANRSRRSTTIRSIGMLRGIGWGKLADDTSVGILQGQVFSAAVQFEIRMQ